MMVKCPHCYAENRDDSRYCSSCAALLSPGVQAGPHDFSFTRTLETPLRVLKAGTLVSGKYRIVAGSRKLLIRKWWAIQDLIL